MATIMVEQSLANLDLTLEPLIHIESSKGGYSTESGSITSDFELSFSRSTATKTKTKVRDRDEEQKGAKS